jgi:transcriptional regulator with XRE-family HTH domain
VAPPQTALSRLLQDRREAAGYSRTRVGELVHIKPGTIEGWELGRVAKPPIHDVLRLAYFLKISPDEVQAAVFEDAGGPPEAADAAGDPKLKRSLRARDIGAVPLLDAAFRIFSWGDDSDAAAALGVSPEQVSRWRRGAEPIELADYMTLTSMIGIAAAAAMKGDQARIADLMAAAELLRPA